MIVKRVKTAADAAGKPVGDPATHYVKKLCDGPAGAVEYLTAKKSEACDVTPDQWEALKRYYRDRPLAGTFSAEAERGVAPKAEKAEVPKADAPKG